MLDKKIVYESIFAFLPEKAAIWLDDAGSMAI